MRNIKTNAMRILESKDIKYEVLYLEIKEAVDGVTCARMLNVLEDKIFKTLVTISNRKINYVFVIPVNKKLDLKKAAKVVLEKNLEMLPMKDLLPLTGYVHGGCSPIGMKKDFKTVVDKQALNFDKIIFSGGKIGCFVAINPLDINKVKQAYFDDVVGD